MLWIVCGHKEPVLISNPLTDILLFFFFNDTATTEIYTLSLHDALPISFSDTVGTSQDNVAQTQIFADALRDWFIAEGVDAEAILAIRSEEHTSELQSPVPISYAVFCLKKKNKHPNSSICLSRSDDSQEACFTNFKFQA